MKFKKRTTLYLAILTMIVIGLLIVLLYRIEVRTNRENAYRSSSLLLDQIKSVIENNDEKLRSLTGSLKDDYVTRSKAISYIIDKNPTIETQITELAWLTNLFSVDEIHLFDSDGTLYSGTKPKYYGENLRTSTRFGAFAKMLDEYNFTMCETVSDEEGGSQMMYAVSWNDAHRHMVMVGITPRRLMNELAMNQMDVVIREFPAYEGIEILVANDSDNVIVGATNESYIGKTLTEAGLTLSDDEKMNTVYTQTATISDEVCYCSLSRYDKYKLVVAQYQSVVNQNIAVPLLLVILYMLIAATVIVLIVRRMTRRIINEHRNANSDAMTQLLNRRAYETAIQRYDSGGYEHTLVYVSMDLNGLKQVNDSMGHDAGDTLIIGAATCMKQCFGNYGDLFRVGGDEFAALIFADEERLSRIKLDFAEEMKSWSDEHGITLSVSCGYVRVSGHEDLSFEEIAKLADNRMYDAKDQYYSKMNITRRM